jgi:hypothetical protein
MKTLNELRAFCEGYAMGVANHPEAMAATLEDTDDWVTWDEYDINFIGAEYSPHARNNNDLYCVVYPAGWVDNLPEPLHSFTIFGETE